MMERFAQAIKLAAKIREESYDLEKASKLKCDLDSCYKLSLHEAADKAAESVGFDERGTLPIYLLLKYCWGDILEWAEIFKDSGGWK